LTHLNSRPTLSRLGVFAQRMSMEPPFRLLTAALVKRLSKRARTHALWDTADRPHYLLGILRAADQAAELGISEIAVAEFGVAGGAGLIRMQEYAAWVQAETGIRIHVLGFDTGAGLPVGTGDFRDHPEIWSPGDFIMDWEALRPRLAAQTQLILGDVRETVPQVLEAGMPAPLGFISIDVDFYSSTRDALRILSLPERKSMIRVVIYLDDAETLLYNRFAGELLAMEQFNQASHGVKIDRWRGIRNNRPFPESGWLDKMYVAYDFEAIDRLPTAGRSKQVLTIDNALNSDG
jgi:hypothetical protein